MTVTIVVTDGADERRGDDIVVWRGRTDDRRGLLDLCEEPSQEVRQRVTDACRWLDDLLLSCSATNEDAQLLVSQSLTTERNFLKSSAVTDIACAIALIDEIERRGARTICYAGKDPSVSTLLAELSRSVGVGFETSTDRARPSGGLTRLKALARLANWIVRRLPLFGAKGRSLPSANSLTVFSYFAPDDLISHEHWNSRYWGSLPDTLISLGYQLTVVNMFVASRGSSASGSARSLQGHANERGALALSWLESWCSVSVIWRTVLKWRQQRSLWSRELPRVREIVSNSHYAWMWSIVANDLERSFLGDVALENCLWNNLFDRLLSSSPQLPAGIYLRENQPWERAMTFHWRRNGHGSLIGFAHSTVREWDLRYVQSPLLEAVPSFAPNVTAANSLDAHRRLSEGLRPSVCALVEATRSPTLAPQELLPKRRILVAGSFEWNRTLEVVNALDVECRGTAWWDEVLIRPHPVTAPADFIPPPGMSLATGELGTVLSRASVVVAVGDTSVALDAYLLGHPVIVLLPPDDLDRSPAPRQPGVLRIATIPELLTMLRSGKQTEVSPDSRLQPTLKPDFPLWTALISQAASRGSTPNDGG